MYGIKQISLAEVTVEKLRETLVKYLWLYVNN